MDEIATQVQLVEDLESSWDALPKNKILEDVIQEVRELSLAWEHGSIKVVLWATVGAMGGIREHILAVDSSIPGAVLDRLILARSSRVQGCLLRLRLMRSRRSEPKTNSASLCRAEMRYILEMTQTNPMELINSIKHQALEGSHNSIEAMSGGLPSLGASSR